MSGTEFCCDVEPSGQGDWIVWIREVDHRDHLEVCALLDCWEREGIGDSGVRRRVGRRRTAKGAERLARRALRRVRRRQAGRDARQARWRQNCTRKAFTVTAERAHDERRQRNDRDIM